MDEDSIRLWIIEKCLTSNNPTELFYLIQSVIDEMESEMTQSRYLVGGYDYWKDVENE